jgi:hypothetical protein
MITAAQARELAATSDSAIEKFLEKLEPKIAAAAEAGKREFAVYEEGLWSNAETYLRVTETPIQARLCAALNRFGFGASVVQHGDAYVPRGLADDAGEGPAHINHVILIRW